MTKEKDRKSAKEQMLLEAARLGQIDQLELILDQFRQLKSKKRTNPLASLRKTIGPNSIRDPVTGFTCLHHAALNGHADCVQLILDCGAKINTVDYKGSSALHLAAWAGNLQVVNVLLNHRVPSAPSHSPAPTLSIGANQQTTDSSQDSPTSVKQSGDFYQYQLARIDIDLRNTDNQTALSLAAQFGHTQVVGQLLTYGANVHLRNNQLESALDLACLNGRLETVDLMLKSSPRLVFELRRSHSLMSASLSPVESSATHEQQESHGGQVTRRASSGGWPSRLLKGKSAEPQHQQSPLQRLTAATLSMRQRSLKQEPQQQQVSPVDRRATLTAGMMGFPPRPLATGGQDQLEDMLLDHSPLHYAVRRNRLNVLNLLLCNYRANLLQVTTLGGLLHEVALNQSLQASKRSDIIGLLFDYIGFSGSQDPLSELQAFLNLKDAHQKSVFQVLAAINNRTAQETTRLIHELSERRIQQLTGQPIGPASCPQEPFNNQMAGFSNNQILVNRSQQQQFGDIHSFVTMKRVPKQHRAPLEPLGCLNQNSRKQPFATQTIDRQTFQQSAQAALARLSSMDVGQYPWPLVSQQQQMTRSVSNLISLPVEHYPCQPAIMADSGLVVEQRTVRPGVEGGHPYDNSAHQLVRSQTDCTYLVSGGPQQLESHEAQGRKTINRHYHVYNQEFYPPRLVVAGAGQEKSVGQISRQMAIVPPLVSGQVAGNQQRQDPARSSVRSTSSSQSDNKCVVPRSRRQDEWLAQPTSIGNHLSQNHNHSRLSLNMDPLSARLARCTSQQAEVTSQPMDRFLNRHSRKLEQQVETSSTSKQSRQDLIELQRRLATNRQQEEAAAASQEQQIHTSLSLESHLSEPHLFESTRKALMHDFDQMIGRELLNRDHRKIIEGRLATDGPASSCSNSQSILTGVMLDMDKYGEQLTVSGTRITLPPSESSKHRPDSRSSRSTDIPLDGNQLQQATSCSSRSSLSSCTRDSLASSVSPRSIDRSEQAPPKPPRPSLLLAQRPISGGGVQKLQTSQKMSGQLEQAVIYDLPASKMEHINLQRTDATMNCTPTGQKGSARAALTEPPSVKPPPPPSDDLPTELTCPLHVVAPTTVSPYISSGTNELGLLKATHSISPGGRNPNHRCLQSVDKPTRQLTKKTSLTDADSGVCTSNSPASMSHDSESNATCLDSKSLECSIKPADDDVQMLLLSTPYEAPPSPNTAQLCIEEALMPLTKSEPTETVSHSTSPAPGATGRLLAVDRWLHVSDQEVGYENCRVLQLELQQQQNAEQPTASSGLNQDDLMARLNAVIGSGNEASPKSASLIGADAEEDEDYAASSSTDDQLIERDSSDHSSYTNNNDVESPESLEQISESSRLRELKLKVVMADQTGDESCSDDQVFYIDPLELKRLSMKRPKANAETLTDEELCASIDKNSGHIKFTLRKRQNNLQEEQSASVEEQQVAEDSNNNTACNVNKQAFVQIRQWFSSNLSGLVEYSSKLVENGFDQLHLLNHPRLLNEETLKTIGIDESSHRTLILESISQSLPPVDLAKLKDAPANMLAALLIPGIQTDQLNFDSLRTKATELPLGHRLRLELALEYLTLAQAPKVLNKQGSSDSELEASQTSSSSKESIKSIVSCKVATVVPQQTGDEGARKQSPNEDQLGRKESPLLKTRSGSLVSEAARRLEAAQKSINSELPPRPVAAVRKMIKPALLDRTNLEEKLSAKCQKSPIKRGPEFVPVRSVCWPPPKANQVDSIGKANEVTARPTGKPSPPIKPANLVARRFGHKS